MIINKKVLGVLVILGLMAVASAPAFATDGSGAVAVTATTVASVDLTFSTNASGITLGGTGTSAATIAFGNVQAYGGSVPSNVTKTINGVTDWTLSTPFDVMVHVSNQASDNYTLTAELNSADAVNTWTINSTAVTSATAEDLTTTGDYDSPTAYTLHLTIPFDAAAGAISNTINFVATAN